MERIDYLVIGHITCDIIPGGRAVGGTVSYSGRIAQALGYHTAVLTSCEPDFAGLQELADLTVHTIPAAATSTFENVYTETGRVQTLHAVANRITAADLPAAWPAPAIAHLGPLTNEIDVDLVQRFQGSIVGLTPQGWMRRWDEDGRVYARAWPDAAAILPLADVVILSQEDLLHDAMLDQYRALSPLLILTENARGCTVFQDGTVRRIPAPAVQEVEPTGAGDIFAAAFLVRYHQTDRNPWLAAEFANFVAAHSVTRPGLAAKIAHIRQELEKTKTL